MLTDKDPHYLLGIEHSRTGHPLYQFADAENQRRYELGYYKVQGVTDPESLERFKRFGEQMTALAQAKLQNGPAFGSRLWQTLYKQTV